MRYWKLNYKILCRKHLLGMHNEFHKFKHHFEKKRSITGYIKNNCIEPKSMKIMHDLVVKEMLCRGYNHHTPYEMPDLSYLPLNELNYIIDAKTSLNTLLNRCAQCLDNFNKLRMYLYGSHYILGKIYKIKDKAVLLVNNTKYSQTTSMHRNDLWRASENHDTIERFSVCNPCDIKESLNEGAGEIVELYFGLFNKRYISWIHENFYDYLIKDHNYICDLFGYPEFKIEYTSFDRALLAELNEYNEKRQAFLSTPEQIAKREKQKAKREKRKQAKLRAQLSHCIEDFRRGEPYRMLLLDKLYPQIIRIKGEQVETSGGARVDLSDAIKLYKALKSGADIQGYKIGFYTVRELTNTHANELTNELTNGYVTIGCHKIEIKEIDDVIGSYLKTKE